jgi:hypothetical protein
MGWPQGLPFKRERAVAPLNCLCGHPEGFTVVYIVVLSIALLLPPLVISSNKERHGGRHFYREFREEFLTPLVITENPRAAAHSRWRSSLLLI